MITVQTRVTIADNTGGVQGQCIKILGHSNRKVAHVGDVIVVSIKTSLLAGKGGKKREAQANKSRYADSAGGGSGGPSGGGNPRGGLTGVRKGEVHKALVIRTKVPAGGVGSIHGLHGVAVGSFEDNAIVILNNKYEPLGTRIFGPINSFELRKRPIAGTLKIISLAQLSL